MVAPGTLMRTREALDSLMAQIRPMRPQRRYFDVDYLLNDTAFVISIFTRPRDHLQLTQQPIFKAVRSDAPDSWQLYVPDRNGRWSSHPEKPVVESLVDAIRVARYMLPSEMNARDWYHEAS